MFTTVLTVNGLKNAQRTVSKPLNKKPKLKEQGLVKFAVGRRLAIYLCSVNKFINYI